MRVQKILTLFFCIVCIPITNLKTQPPVADHHLHIRSEAGTEALVKILEEMRGQENIQIKPNIDADDVITMLDSSGTEKAVLLPVAYFFSIPEVEFENEKNRIRQENEYVANQAEKYPNRLVAVCAVNPLSDYALDEISWCGESGRFKGLKLHFANSDSDLQNPEDVDKLKSVFREANEQNLAIIAHIFTRNPDYGSKDVSIFIDELMPEAPDIPVQVAHLGGPGTYSEVTRDVADRFIEAVKSENPLLDNVYFDLAEVPLQPGSKDENDDFDKLNQKLAEQVRDLGAEKVLWGTDWIAGPQSVYLSKLQSVALPDSLWKQIRKNRAPYVR